MADRDRTVLTVVCHGLAIETRQHVAVGVIGEAMRADLAGRMRVVGCVKRIGVVAKVRLRGDAARAVVAHHPVKGRIQAVQVAVTYSETLTVTLNSSVSLT